MILSSRGRILAFAVAVGAPLAIVAALAQDAGPEVRSGEVTHTAPPDIGDGNFQVVEVPEGGSYQEPAILDLRRGRVTIPQAYGIFWGFGDTPCGYGLNVRLPAGTTVCFDEDQGEVEVSSVQDADRDLMEAILQSAPNYRVRASVLTGETP